MKSIAHRVTDLEDRMGVAHARERSAEADDAIECLMSADAGQAAVLAFCSHMKFYCYCRYN